MLIRFVVLALTILVLSVAPVRAETAPAQIIWRLLDYIAVDYPEAVDDGKIINQAEYDEMKEFSASASKRIAELPPSAARAHLETQAGELERIIAEKAPAPAIATVSRTLAADIIKAYPVPLAPANAPDVVTRGRDLYAQHCAGCHGLTGKGDGPQAVGLDPPAIAFTDEKRARERSIFALYQVIEQGLDGTSMQSFSELPSQDIWALAFYAGSLSSSEEQAEKGKARWSQDADQRIGLEKLVSTTPAAFAAERGDDPAQELMAYLRRHPDATAAVGQSHTLSLARGKLDEALSAYTRGDQKAARDHALSAYLDGFEPVEAVLSARDNVLMVSIEGAMADIRESIARNAPVETVKARIATLDGLFEQAESALSPGSASATSSFVAAFTILVREGLEAILIIVAMLVFLTRAGRRDMVPYVHGGSIAALVAGAATWVVATWFITISGASRELTEGLGSVFAALVLLWVGLWMHSKSNANAWQHYINEKLSRALNRRSAWVLFALAFVVVYREVFETILFYTAIWAQGDGGAVLAGALAAIVVLAIVAILMTRYSRSLPMGKFFSYSSLLMGVLAVVLIGKGTSALQEAGYLPVVRWPGVPRSDLLGLFPTRETLLAQIVMIALLVLGFAWNRRPRKQDASAA